MINGVLITPLKIITVKGGDVLHAMKSSDDGFSGFGEAYFSVIDYGVIKAWKRHKKMQINFIVPKGKIRFVLYNDRDGHEVNNYQEVILSLNNYSRLTIPPMIWFGFQGLAEESSMLLNLASLEHAINEVDSKPIDEIKYNWERS